MEVEISSFRQIDCSSSSSKCQHTKQEADEAGLAAQLGYGIGAYTSLSAMHSHEPTGIKLSIEEQGHLATQLRCAVSQCTERGLYNAAKW